MAGIGALHERILSRLWARPRAHIRTLGAFSTEKRNVVRQGAMEVVHKLFTDSIDMHIA